MVRENTFSNEAKIIFDNDYIEHLRMIEGRAVIPDFNIRFGPIRWETVESLNSLK
jgi:hypothetical protein